VIFPKLDAIDEETTDLPLNVGKFMTQKKVWVKIC
jgi:hypothetical protein